MTWRRSRTTFLLAAGSGLVLLAFVIFGLMMAGADWLDERTVIIFFPVILAVGHVLVAKGSRWPALWIISSLNAFAYVLSAAALIWASGNDWAEGRNFTIMWIGIFMLPSIGISVLTPIFAFIEWVKMPRPKTPGFCARCGYNLTGNVSGVCPECGEPT